MSPPRVSNAGVAGMAACAVWLASAACDNTVDFSPRNDLIRAETIQVTHAVAGEPSIFFIDETLRNVTQTTVNNFHDATVTAGATSASFPLGYNVNPSTLVGCVSPDPWDIRPGEAKAVRLRIDFSADPAVFTVACAFDPAMPGIDYSSSRVYKSPRKGPALTADFTGAVQVELYATMNADCTPDDCPFHARVNASAPPGD